MGTLRQALFFIVLRAAPVVPFVLFPACDNGQETDDNEDFDSDETEGSDPEVSGEIEIFTWWTAPGEADALNALLSVYSDQYPNVNVLNISGILGDGNAAMTAIRARIDSEEAPPDVMQISAGYRDINTWTNYEGTVPGNKLEPVDDLWNEEGWSERYPEKVKSIMTDTDGRIYGIPIGMHRFNTIIVNKNLVPDPPTSYQEFLDLAQDISSQGGIPVIFCEDAWTLDIMLHSVLASVDTDMYERFYFGELDTNGETGQAFLRTGFERFLEILTYASPAPATTSEKSCWLNASEAIYEESAAMFFHPDWVKGYLSSLGFAAGIDFDAVPVFGTEAVFRFNLDSFILFKDAPNMENAMRFLSVAGSPEGQVAFNTIKGSTPVTPNIDRQSTAWDSIAESTKQHFDTATYRLWDIDYANQNMGQIGYQLYDETLTIDEAIMLF